MTHRFVDRTAISGEPGSQQIAVGNKCYDIVAPVNFPVPFPATSTALGRTPHNKVLVFRDANHCMFLAHNEFTAQALIERPKV